MHPKGSSTNKHKVKSTVPSGSSPSTGTVGEKKRVTSVGHSSMSYWEKIRFGVHTSVVLLGLVCCVLAVLSSSYGKLACLVMHLCFGFWGGYGMFYRFFFPSKMEL